MAFVLQWNSHAPALSYSSANSWTSWCPASPDAYTEFQRETLCLLLHVVPILSLCLSSPLVPPTHCFSLTIMLQLHLLPPAAAGSLPISPASLPLSLPSSPRCAVVLRCSAARWVHPAEEKRTNRVHTSSSVPFHGFISSRTEERHCLTRECHFRVSTALLSCAGQDQGKATVRTWP